MQGSCLLREVQGCLLPNLQHLSRRQLAELNPNQCFHHLQLQAKVLIMKSTWRNALLWRRSCHIYRRSPEFSICLNKEALALRLHEYQTRISPGLGISSAGSNACNRIRDTPSNSVSQTGSGAVPERRSEPNIRRHCLLTIHSACLPCYRSEDLTMLQAYGIQFVCSRLALARPGC